MSISVITLAGICRRSASSGRAVSTVKVNIKQGKLSKISSWQAQAKIFKFYMLLLYDEIHFCYNTLEMEIALIAFTSSV
jgi:hypothetical protein